LVRVGNDSRSFVWFRWLAVARRRIAFGAIGSPILASALLAVGGNAMLR